MINIDDVISEMNNRIIKEETYLIAHKACLECDVSKKIISFSSLGALLITVYFFFTEKNLAVLMNKEIRLFLVWILVTLIPFVLVLTSTKRCYRIESLLAKRSAVNDWLKTKTFEQQQSFLAIMRSRGLI